MINLKQAQRAMTRIGVLQVAIGAAGAIAGLTGLLSSGLASALFLYGMVGLHTLTPVEPKKKALPAPKPAA